MGREDVGGKTERWAGPGVLPEEGIPTEALGERTCLGHLLLRRLRGLLLEAAIREALEILVGESSRCDTVVKFFPVPDVEVGELSQNRDLLDDLGPLPQWRLHENPTLPVHAGYGAVVGDRFLEATDDWIERGDCDEPCLDLEPDRERIEAHRPAIETRDVEIASILSLDDLAILGGDLQSTLLVHPRQRAPSEH